MVRETMDMAHRLGTPGRPSRRAQPLGGFRRPSVHPGRRLCTAQRSGNALLTTDYAEAAGYFTEQARGAVNTVNDLLGKALNAFQARFKPGGDRG